MYLSHLFSMNIQHLELIYDTGHYTFHSVHFLHFYKPKITSIVTNDR